MIDISAHHILQITLLFLCSLSFLFLSPDCNNNISVYFSLCTTTFILLQSYNVLLDEGKSIQFSCNSIFFFRRTFAKICRLFDSLIQKMSFVNVQTGNSEREKRADKKLAWKLAFLLLKRNMVFVIINIKYNYILLESWHHTFRLCRASVDNKNTVSA